ncbi:MAG: hypothetical protein H7641_05710 [Candidatus Heimdallarchaeota archaeon]|nr:hypothetical protein [Candidatus Heimdallarchaeota archaeon]MCK4877057.1 hypothetical protein [Candidatus Heimdallarchaeota archaeon]
MKGKIVGILVEKLVGEDTLSDGPEYYLQPLDEYKTRWEEILVRKKTNMWQKDPELHKFIDKKVEIIGEVIETINSITIDYIKIREID